MVCVPRDGFSIGLHRASISAAPLQTVSALCGHFFCKFWRRAGVRLRQEILLHDLITETACLGAQHGIPVLGVNDAFFIFGTLLEIACRGAFD